jgi:hypothetical protein
MKLKSRLIEIAGVGLLVAFASSSDALAQGSAKGTAEKGAQTTGKAAGDASAPSQGPWTADNVTAARPFGNMDVSAAGSSTDSVRTWSQGRTASERNELNGRCAVINNPANTARYPANAQQFCRNYTVASNQAGPTKSGSTTSGSNKTGKY